MRWISMTRNYAGTSPSDGGAHLDVPLANVAISAFQVGGADFIADQLFPAVPVDKRSNKYYIIDPQAFLRDPALEALRAPKTAAHRIEFRVSSDSYYCQNWALANENALEDLANADLAIDLRRNSALLIVTNLQRAQEGRIANICTSGTNVGSGALLSGINKWSDMVNSDPLANVATGHAFIRSQTGLTANTAVMDWDTMMTLRRHPQMLDLYKYTAGGQVTMQQIADALSVDKLLIGRAVKDTSNEGAAASMTNMWGNNCLLCRVNPATGLQTATLGLRFSWTPPGLSVPFAVERSVYDMAGSRKVETIEAGHWQDEKVVAKNLGYLIGTTL